MTYYPDIRAYVTTIKHRRYARVGIDLIASVDPELDSRYEIQRASSDPRLPDRLRPVFLAASERMYRAGRRSRYWIGFGSYMIGVPAGNRGLEFMRLSLARDDLPPGYIYECPCLREDADVIEAAILGLLRGDDTLAREYCEAEP